MTLYISYSLTATWTFTFGYLKWTPDVAFTGNFSYIVFDQYVRQDIGRKKQPKMRNELVAVSFCLACLKNIGHGVTLIPQNERLKCITFEIKVSLG